MKGGFKKYSKSHHGTMHELNITPLLDLAFVLLVIFIITTAPMVNDLDLNLPSKAAAAKAPPPRKLNFVIVEADGTILFNGQPVRLEVLKTTLAGITRRLPEANVIVHGHSTVAYQNMVSVFDVLQQCSVTNVGLATERPTMMMQTNLSAHL